MEEPGQDPYGPRHVLWLLRVQQALVETDPELATAPRARVLIAIADAQLRAMREVAFLERLEERVEAAERYAYSRHDWPAA